MKLLSMKIDGEDRAGIVLEDAVIDVTAFCQLYHSKFEQGNWFGNVTVFRDALDVYKMGMEWAEHLLWVLETYSLQEECKKAGIIQALAAITLNPPVLQPQKILAVGLNYAAHAAEQNIKPPTSPLVFTKNVTALIAPDAKIQLPAKQVSDSVDYEAELAFVIGKDAKNVKVEEAYEYIAGYTIMNDVTARDLQQNEKQWARAKGLDTFAPCGPYLVTTDEITDPHTLDISLRVNGELRQSSNTDDLIFKIPFLLAFISQDLTLKQGDMITTGTPSGVGVYMQPPSFLKDGDEIEVTLEKVGKLTNSVVGAAS
jgi:2-keto-4-pentenoate hydratase/2-oxohepta-3-ene-1,7-dioic acid hydratase in catechol pathway